MRKNTKIQENHRKNSFIQSHKGLFLMFMVVTLIGLSSPLTSASDWFSVDNYKKTTFCDNFPGQGIGVEGKLPNGVDNNCIQVWDKDIIGADDLLASIQLTKNTYSCGKDCYAEGIIEIYDSGKIIEDMRFIKQSGDEWYEEPIQDYKTFIKTGDKQVLVETIETDCSESIHNCFQRVIGNHYEIQPVWTEYNGEDLLPGEYVWRIEGTKSEYETVDWLATFYGGLEVDEWALWNQVIGAGFIDDFDRPNNASVGDFWINKSSDGLPLTGQNYSIINNQMLILFGSPGDNLRLETNNSFLNITGTPLELEFNISSEIEGTGSNSGGLIGFEINDDGNTVSRVRFNDTIVSMLGTTLSGSNSTALVADTFNVIRLRFDWTLNRTELFLNDASVGVVTFSTNRSQMTRVQLNSLTSEFNATIDYIQLGSQDLTNISLISPEDAVDVIDAPLFFNCSVTSLGSSQIISNLSLIIDGVRNYTNMTSANNMTIERTISNIPQGVHNWTCRSTNSTNFIQEVANRTFNLSSVQFNSETFNVSTAQMVSETFRVNVTTNGSLTTGDLIYNGTLYAGTEVKSGNTSEFTRVLTIPSDTFVGNVSFFWNFTFGNTSIQQHNVSLSTLGLCNSTLNIPYLNFSFRNETTAEEIVNASIPTSTFNYYIDDVDVNKTLLFSNASENLNYPFCFTPQDRNVTAQINLDYDNAESEQRSFAETRNLGNTTTNKLLYLLPTSEGFFITFIVVDGSLASISGATVTANRTIGGTSTEVASGTTDDAGAVTFWLNSNFAHSILAKASGFDDNLRSITPTTTPFTIVMGGATGANFSDYSRGISFNITPFTNGTLFNGTDYNFSLQLSSSYYSLDNFGFTLENLSGTVYTTQSAVTNGGTLSAIVNTGENETLRMIPFWTALGNRSNGSAQWAVFVGGETNWSLDNFANDLNTYIDDEIFGMDRFAFSIILFIVMFMFIGYLSYQFGLQSPASIVFAIAATITFLDVGLNLMQNLMPSGIAHGITALSWIFFAFMFAKEVRG